MVDKFPKVAGSPPGTDVLFVDLGYRAGAVRSMQNKSYDF